jgi:uncharacterized protein (TIGR04551 family)
MTLRPSHRPLVGGATFAAAALTFLFSQAAQAQYGPGMSPGGMNPPAPMGQEPKEEGPAEEAPEEATRPADEEPLQGYGEETKRKVQVFELNGYLRLRTDYMHNFYLSQGYSGLPSTTPTGTPTNYGLPPFPVPLDCPRPDGNIPSNMGPNPNDAGRGCSHKSVGGANLRLRLEPTINVTDNVRVFAQVDILDNTILGSTPDSLAGIPGYTRPLPQDPNSNAVNPNAVPGQAPTDFQATSQDPPEVGRNGFGSSIRAKRAWGEIDSEFGSLRFGRMPWNWGRGIYYNDGSCPDCDVGTTVDRVMALTTLYNHQIALAWDLGSQGWTTQQLYLGRDSPEGYGYDLSQNDDVFQMMGSILRRDNPVQLRERIDRGEPVFNYGLQVVYKLLGNDSQPNATTLKPPTATSGGSQPLTPEQLTQGGGMQGNSQSDLGLVGALTITPDVWAKFYYKALTIEFEGIGVFGKIDHPGILAVDDQRVTLRQLGWVLASELRLYREAFFIGLETGGATGDQAEDPTQYLNYRWKFVRQQSGDHAINDFHFSPSYHVDEIFFRHIMGTVTNAIYVKPKAAYWFDLGQTRAVGLQGGVVYSIAQVPVSTPGNSLNYGAEFDAGVNYRNTGEGIYGGVTWGIFFPLGALERPADLWGQSASSASLAQTLRIFMGIRF